MCNERLPRLALTYAKLHIRRRDPINGYTERTGRRAPLWKRAIPVVVTTIVVAASASIAAWNLKPSANRKTRPFWNFSVLMFAMARGA